MRSAARDGAAAAAWLAGHAVVTVRRHARRARGRRAGLGPATPLVTGDAGAVLRLSVAGARSLAPAVLVLERARPAALRASRAAAGRSLAGAARGVGVLAVRRRASSCRSWLRTSRRSTTWPDAAAEDFRLAPSLVLTALAAALSAAGQLAFRRRDLHGAARQSASVTRHVAARAGVARAARRHRHLHRRRLADRRSAAGPSSSSGWRRRPSSDPGELSDPRHFAYWRRAADVVTARARLDATPGLRAPG